MAAIYDGGTWSKAARIGGVGLQIVRDWVVRFNERGPDALIDGKAPGALPLLPVVEAGPIPASHGVVRWRLVDLLNGFGTSSGSRSASRR